MSGLWGLGRGVGGRWGFLNEKMVYPVWWVNRREEGNRSEEVGK